MTAKKAPTDLLYPEPPAIVERCIDLARCIDDHATLIDKHNDKLIEFGEPVIKLCDCVEINETRIESLAARVAELEAKFAKFN